MWTRHYFVIRFRKDKLLLFPHQKCKSQDINKSYLIDNASYAHPRQSALLIRPVAAQYCRVDIMAGYDLNTGGEEGVQSSLFSYAMTWD